MTAVAHFASDAKLDLLRYSQAWEDHRLLGRGLRIGPGDDVLSIAGSGANVLALLLAAPRSIIALDVNRAQLALLELKLAAIERLSHHEFACLVGARAGADRQELYERVRDGLGTRARAHWDVHLADLERGVLGAGMLERYFERFRERHLAQLDLSPLLDLDDRGQQASLYDRLLGTPEFEAAVRATFTPEAMAGQARDATQFRYVTAQDVPGYFLRRLRYVCTQLPTRGNFYLEWFLTGRYRDLDAGPPFLRPANFERLRALAGRVTIVEDELSRFLAAQPPGAVSAANLSDVFEYVSEDTTAELLELLVSRLRPGGRVAYWNLLVPRSSSRLPALRGLSHRLWLQDRVFFYSDFCLNTTP
jgi:S-adenosylmethionine-diacylglycerol 3-amino-3-carboxypropyl transferase